MASIYALAYIKQIALIFFENILNLFWITSAWIIFLISQIVFTSSKIMLLKEIKASNILAKLECSFDLYSCAPNIVAGLDTAVLPIMINGQKITVGWDIWSGIFIMADTAEEDIVIEQVYSCLKETQ